MPVKFTHLFFDTNVLETNWPGFSVEVANTFKAARSLGVIIVIPQPVLLELNKHWRMSIDASIKTAKNTLNKVATLMGNPHLPRALPDWKDLEQGYDRAIGTLLEQNSFEVGPIAQIGVAELFEQANNERLVFGEHGKNFKDAVIFHSVVEYLGKWGGSGVLVSNDAIFQKRKTQCESHAEEREITLRLFKLEEAEAHFRDLLGDETKQRIDRHRNLARKAVEGFLPTAQAAFNTTLDRQRLWSGEAIPENVAFQKLADVDVSVLDADPPEGAEMRISAIFRGIASIGLANYQGMQFRVSGSNAFAIEVGMVFSARYEKGQYRIEGIMSTTHGWPAREGSLAHPNWRGHQEAVVTTEEAL